MTETADDAQLVQRIAEGDQHAVRTLFTRHQARIYRFTLRLVRNPAVAEEIVNEVFVEAWRGAGRFEAKSAVGTWLLSIARNRAVSTLRKRREEAWNEERDAAVAADGDDPEVAAQKHDKGRIMRRCMEQLSGEHREILDLVYYHELSVAEVAVVVGIPESTVKTRMFYARKRLSELLRAAGVDRGWP